VKHATAKSAKSHESHCPHHQLNIRKAYTPFNRADVQAPPAFPLLLGSEKSDTFVTSALVCSSLQPLIIMTMAFMSLLRLLLGLRPFSTSLLDVVESPTLLFRDEKLERRLLLRRTVVCDKVADGVVAMILVTGSGLAMVSFGLLKLGSGGEGGLFDSPARSQ